MAQEVKIAGALFEDVPRIQVPDSNDVYHPFVDPSVTTATASDVSSGKVFIASDGTETTGTGASTITSTYSNGTVTLNTESVSVAWWGGLNPTRLYETTYTMTLDQTNFASKTPSTSAQALTLPATSYSSAATRVIFDRWGTSYHSGSKLDFANYDYFILSKQMVNIAYTSDESSLGINHSLQHQQIYLFPIGQSYRIASNAVVHATSSTAGTTRAHSMAIVGTVYRNSSNNLGMGASTSYGIYPTPSAPAFQSTSALTSTYISFYSPYWYIRTHASTYMAAGAWAYVDAENTTMTQVQTLYRVRKQDIVEQAWEQMASMWENKTIPTEVL